MCISGKNLAECQEQAAGKHSAELRLDLLSLDPLELKQLWDSCEEWILTLRKEFTERPNWKEIFKFCLDLKPVYVDVDSALPEELVSEVKGWVKATTSELMLSYHNFEKTPELEVLMEVIHHLKELGADVIKIACMANEEEDNLIVMDLYREHDRLVAFCMGEEGRESRVTSLFFGEKMTYAAPSEDAVIAAGQLTYGQLSDFLNLGFDDEG